MAERSFYKPEDAYSIPIPEGFDAQATLARLPNTPTTRRLQEYGKFHTSLPTTMESESTFVRNSSLLRYPDAHVLNIDPIIPLLAFPLIVAVGIASGDIRPKNKSHIGSPLQSCIVETLCGLLDHLQHMKQGHLRWEGFSKIKRQGKDIFRFFSHNSESGEVMAVNKRVEKNGYHSLKIEYQSYGLRFTRKKNASPYTYVGDLRCDREGDDLVVDVDVIQKAWKIHDGKLIFDRDVKHASLIHDYLGEARHHVPYLYGDSASIEHAQNMITQSLGLDTLFQTVSPSNHAHMREIGTS